jgi:CheY-like chemotaxis protein
MSTSHLEPSLTGRGDPTLKALVVEDNAVSQKLAVHLLKQQGYEVQVAGDGQAALDAVGHDAFDIVLLDLHLPDMEGDAVARRLRQAEPPGRHTAIIALSAESASRERDRCLTSGMDGFLSKPLRAADLSQVLLSTMSRAPSGPDADAGARLEAQAKLKPGAQAKERANTAAQTGIPRRSPAWNQLVDSFGREWPQLMTRIHDAAQAHDRDALLHAAHSLRGCAYIFGAAAASDTLSRMEDKARLLDWNALQLLESQLQQEIKELTASLNE